MNFAKSWNFNLILDEKDNKKREELKIEFKKRIEDFVSKWKDNPKISNPDILIFALDDYARLIRDFSGGGPEGYYFWLKTQKNQLNTDFRANANLIENYSRELWTNINFFEIQLGKLSDDDKKRIINSEKLIKYKHFLERVFIFSKYNLSEAEERIIILKKNTSYKQWIEMLSTFLSKEERNIKIDNKLERKNFSEICSLINDKNKITRDSAAFAINDIFNKFVDVAEFELNAILSYKQIEDKLRKMSRPDLSRHLSDDIESEVVDNLVKVVSSRFDIPKKYYSLKAKLLGVEKLEYHERNVLYGSLDDKYEFDKTVFIIKKTFVNLDINFSKMFEKALLEERVDVYPEVGKRSGAFCVWWSPSMPVFIMLNHNNTLRDVLTFAHELGHLINIELSIKKQNALTYDVPTSMAEVASTFMEDFVLEELIKISDDEKKLALIMFKIGEDVSTIFRQIACYNFEKDLHEQFSKIGYLSKEKIGEIFKKHMQSYMGDSVIQSKGSENWWIHWSHIRNYFYVYSYAFGLLISKILQSNVKKDKNYIKIVKEIFSAGSSNSPYNLFFNANIDILDEKSFLMGINEIDDLLNQAYNLAKKLGKIK